MPAPLQPCQVEQAAGSRQHHAPFGYLFRRVLKLWLGASIGACDRLSNTPLSIPSCCCICHARAEGRAFETWLALYCCYCAAAISRFCDTTRSTRTYLVRTEAHKRTYTQRHCSYTKIGSSQTGCCCTVTLRSRTEPGEPCLMHLNSSSRARSDIMSLMFLWHNGNKRMGFRGPCPAWQNKADGRMGLAWWVLPDATTSHMKENNNYAKNSTQVPLS